MSISPMKEFKKCSSVREERRKVRAKCKVYAGCDKYMTKRTGDKGSAKKNGNGQKDRKRGKTDDPKQPGHEEIMGQIRVSTVG